MAKKNKNEDAVESTEEVFNIGTAEREAQAQASAKLAKLKEDLTEALAPYRSQKDGQSIRIVVANLAGVNSNVTLLKNGKIKIDLESGDSLEI